MKKISIVGLLCLAIFGSVPAAGEDATVFTYRSSESDRDPRYHYGFAVLRLALDKTVVKYGPYQLKPSPRMTFPRAIKAVEYNQYPNFFVKLSYEQRLVSDLKFVFAKYPVDRGIVGYRVCFSNPESKKRLSTVESVADLKEFVIGQGSGWSDVEILRSNGFKATSPRI
jgi:hypothetical protein